jgi:hypothetical protein
MTDIKENPEAERSSASGRSDQQREQSWYKQPSILIAALALVVSISSAVITIFNNISQTQGQEHQQLFTLIQDLSQIPSQRVTLQSTYARNPAQLRSLGGQLLSAEIVDVQEAAQIIDALNGQVASQEAYQVGSSLVDVGFYPQSLKYFSIAISHATGFPETAASTYRVWAEALYDLGEPTQARSKISLADSSFDVAGMSSRRRTQNFIYTSLFQLPYEVQLHNCSFVRAQFRSDLKLIASLSSSSPSSYAQDTAQAAGEESSINNCS